MFRIFLFFAALCFLLPASSSARGFFVYVSNYGDGTISQFRANRNGTLTPLNPPSVKAYPRCHSLATDTTGRFLYVLSALDFSRRNCLISQFCIGPDGRLTPLSPPHVPLDEKPYLIVANPSSPGMCVLNYSGSLTQFLIRKNGSLAPHFSPKAGVYGWFNFSIALDRQNSVFYATGQIRMTNEWLGGVSAFRAGNDGTLRPVRIDLPDNGGLATGKYAPYPPQQVVVSQQRRSAYILYQGFAPIAKTKSAPAGDLEAVLTQYRILSNGNLRPLRPPRVLIPGTPQETMIDPQSRHCYLFVLPDYLDGYPVKTDKIILARYAIRGDGTLGRCSQQTLTVPDGLFHPVFDPTGHTLYLLAHNGIHLFHVHSDGSVSALSPGSIHAGHGPLEMLYVQQ